MMNSTRFEATVRREPGTQVAVVDMRGAINALAERELNDAYAQTIESDPARILLHFGKVDYINRRASPSSSGS